MLYPTTNRNSNNNNNNLDLYSAFQGTQGRFTEKTRVIPNSQTDKTTGGVLQCQLWMNVYVHMVKVGCLNIDSSFLMLS